ncbi:hypothetical protein M758_1G127100 [Ceratodon purpureus]|nr:hypothetical protein M758_1G127100 [Ceratodon purpureus]
MDGAIVPLTFYCRNAQLCLAKATEAQKSGFAAEELQHLKTFTTLVSETIPSHPNFCNRQEDKQVLELHAYLPEAAKRIRELEKSGCLEPICPRPHTKTHGRQSSRHPKPPLASSVASRSPAKTSRLAEGREGLREQESSVTVGTVATNQDEEDRSWNETSDDNSRSTLRTGDESSPYESTKHIQHRRKKQQEEHQRHGPRGNGLREWKGDFVRKSERIHGGCDEGETRALQSKRRHNVQGRVDSRSASAPRRMQGVVLKDKPKEAGENLDEAESNDSESKQKKSAVLAPGFHRGMKEDCEHFRRDMQILTEKANNSRMSLREAELEGMAHEKLHRRVVDEMDLAACDANEHKHDRDRTLRSNTHKDKEKVSTLRGTVIDSPRINRLRGGHKDEPGCAQPSQQSQQSQSATASGSSSGSSLTSLPLSHYIQKLKNFSPDSQLNSANLELLTHVNKAVGNCSSQHDHPEKFAAEDTEALNECGHGVGLLPTVLAGGSASAIFLPAPTNSPGGGPHGLPRPSPRLVENRFVPPASSALYTSLAHPTQLMGNSRMRPSPPDTSSVAMFNSNPELHLTAHHDMDRAQPMVTTLNDQHSYPQYQNDTENDLSLEAKDDKLNNIQRVLGELKGSVKGMKIRLEVDGQGWRGRVEGLERELENLKEEADDEIIAAKHSLRNEMKVKLGDLMAEMERIRRQERDEVEVMVEERIEKQLKALKAENRTSVDMKDEIRLLWAEMDALVKSRQEMQGHVEHLTSVAQKAQEHANREHEMLKSENGYLRKQLQSLKNEGVQVRLETEDFRMEREDLRLAMDKLKVEGTDMKLEIQSLKKVEKLIKAELENVRTGLAKFQEETQELEQQRGILQVEVGRERIMIMEKVESLSQRYLGGLEEVKADLFSVKFHCRDRIQEFENQWNAFRKLKPEGSNFASKQMLVDELDHFRREIAEMVEIERGLVRQTFERESEAIQRQVKDLFVSSKGEIVNVLKLDVQKWLQGTHERVFLMTESLKQDLDTLKNELGRTQEGAEDLIQIITAAEIQRDVAAAAAADASMSATKASNVLMDATRSIDSEMQDAHRRIKQFQDNLIAEKEILASTMHDAQKVSQELQKEKEVTLVIVQEARQKHKELQDYLERESSRLLTTLMIVQKERDSASQAASEATSSAMKAREVLAEILDTYNLEMAKLRHVSLQLQEGLENEKEGLERDREMAIKHSYNAQDRFSEELELAIDGWKQAMNIEISKAKGVADELQKQLSQRSLFEPDHPNLQMSSSGFVEQSDLKNFISKTEESISGLAAMVKELQDYKECFSEEKKRRMILKQQENERKEQHWNGEISQINQVVRVVEKRVLDACEDYTEVRKRLKKCEGAHVDLVHTVKEVSSNTSELAKTVSSWLPRYEAAARIVNDLSCKVERVEEKFEGFSCDEGLVQRISRIAETKVEGLKELVASNAAMVDIGQELRDLHERVENSDRVHCQALGEVANRVAQLEHIPGPGQPSPGLSLKVEYTDSADARKQGMGSLSQSVEALERKMEYMTEHTGAMVGGHESAIDSRLLGLESRIEHVASATFTNLRLLDSKVDRVSVGMQSAVEGAALAESKCGALGAELVKVFRMLTASNSGSSTSRLHSIADTQCERSHSPPTQTPQVNPEPDSGSQSPRNRFPTFPRGKSRTTFSPRRRSRIYISPNRPKTALGPNRGGLRNMTRNGEAKFIARDHEQAEVESTNSGASEEGTIPNKHSCYYLRTSVNDPPMGCKLHTQGTQLSVHKAHERRQDRTGRHTSAIRLEAGRLHVGHRSEKRENMIAVQS